MSGNSMKWGGLAERVRSATLCIDEVASWVTKLQSDGHLALAAALRDEAVEIVQGKRESFTRAVEDCINTLDRVQAGDDLPEDFAKKYREHFGISA